MVGAGGSGGNAGTSSAGHADSGGSAGSTADAGTGADVGDAGSETGGVGGAPASGGAGGLLGLAGGLGGVAGAVIEPTLPSTGLLLWLRADYGIQQKDGRVQKWLDQSGNQIDATQGSSNEQPKYLATGFNGRPTLEFDGQGQFLKFEEGFGDFSKGLVGVILAKPSKSDCASMLEFSNGSEVDDIALGMWQNKWTYEVTEPLIQSGNVNLQAFSRYAVNHRPTGIADLRINGSTLTTLNMPLPASVVRVNDFVGHTLYAGGCEYFKGQISEIIMYSRSLPSSDLNAIEKYLEEHWALAEQDSAGP